MNRILACLMAILLLVAVANPLKAVKAEELAIRGYDPIAYWTTRKPVKGSKQHQLSWNNVTWRFSSEKNLKRFKSNPEKYAPQYNGWCAYAVSSGGAAEIDPINGWSFAQGKLFLNWSTEVKALWSLRESHYINQANQNWPDVQKKIAAGEIDISRK